MDIIDNISANKRIARNSIYMSVRMVIVLIISLYTTRAILNSLGVSDYGIYNVVGGFVTMFAFLNTSLSNGIQRFYNFELGKNGEAGAQKVYVMSLLVQIVMAFLIILVTEPLGLWYLYNKMVIPDSRFYASVCLFHFAVINMFFVIIQAPYVAAIMAHEKLDYFSLIGIIDVLLKLIIVIALPYLGGDKLIIFGALMTIISIANFVFYFVYAYRKFSEIRIHYSLDIKMLQSMLSFSGWNIFGSFSLMLREQGVNLVLNFFYGPVVNAARGIASQINAALEGFTTNLTIPARPQVIQSYAQGNLSRALHLTYCISKLCCYFMILLSVPVVINIKCILQFWLGDNIPDHSGTFVLLVLSTTLINILMGGMATIVHATARMKDYQLYGGLIKILSVPAAFFLLNLGMAPEWALVCVLFFNFLGFIVGLYIIKRIVDFNPKDYYINVIIPILIVLFISFSITFLLSRILIDGWVKVITTFIVAGASCSLSAFFLGLNQAEKSILFSLVDKIKSKFTIR